MKRMMKRTVTILLAAMMLMSTLSTGVGALEVASGTCGEDLTWALDNAGTLTVSGTGAMDEYTYENKAPWHDKYVKTVIVDNGVTSIGSYAFEGIVSLVNMRIADSVESIGDDAFLRCTSLTDVRLPNGLTTISNAVFYECSSLETITIPDSVTYIGGYAFYSCKSLKGINIPDGITSVEGGTFGACTNLKTVEIPYGVTEIGLRAFAGSGILKITIPTSVTRINSHAFYNCKSIANITIPGSVNEVGGHAFHGCTSLTHVSIENGVKNIGAWAFQDCGNLSSLTVPGSVTTVGGQVLSGCAELKTAGPIGGGYDYEFGWKHTFPQSAFDGCAGLVSVTIPDSVTKIEAYAFNACKALADVFYPGSESDRGKINIGAYGNDTLTGAEWHYNYSPASPAAISGTCGENVQWAFDEESGVLSLSGTGAMDSLDAFADYGYSVWKDDVQFVAVADGVTSIGAHAFEGCPILEEVILGENVTQIGEAALADCPRLMNVTLLSDTISADGAFPEDRMDWMLIFPNQNTQAIGLAKRHGVSWITVSYADDVLSFGGTITVHDGYAYSYAGQTFDPTGMTVTAYYDDGTSEFVEPSYSSEPFSLAETPEQEVTLSYAGRAVTITVSVIDYPQQTTNMLIVNNTDAQYGGLVTIPVAIQNNTGLIGFELYVEYDPMVLSPKTPNAAQNAEMTSSLTMNDGLVSDVLKVAAHGTGDEIVEDGNLAYVSFYVKDDADFKQTTIRVYGEMFNTNPNNGNLYQTQAFRADEATIFLSGDPIPYIVLPDLTVPTGEAFDYPVELRHFIGCSNFSFMISYDADQLEMPSLQVDGVNISSIGEGILSFESALTHPITEDSVSLTLRFDPLVENIDNACFFVHDAQCDGIGIAAQNGSVTSVSLFSTCLYADDLVIRENTETVVIPVYIKNNHGFMGLSLQVLYDTEDLLMTNIFCGELLKSGIMDTDVEEPGVAHIVFSSYSNVIENGIAFELEFQILPSWKGHTTILLDYSQDSVFNETWEAVVLECVSFSIIKVCPGDADEDGAVTLQDVVVITRWLAGGWNVTINETNSDVNRDEEINLKDVVLIRRFLAGGWNVVLR